MNTVRRRAAGTRRRSHPGSSVRSTSLRAGITASRQCGWAKAAPSRSWPCWARSSRRLSSSSPACSARIPTRTARTSSCTSTTPSASPRALPTFSRRTPRAEKPSVEGERQDREAQRRAPEDGPQAPAIDDARSGPKAHGLAREEKRREQRDRGAALLGDRLAQLRLHRSVEGVEASADEYQSRRDRSEPRTGRENRIAEGQPDAAHRGEAQFAEGTQGARRDRRVQDAAERIEGDERAGCTGADAEASLEMQRDEGERAEDEEALRECRGDEARQRPMAEEARHAREALQDRGTRGGRRLPPGLKREEHGDDEQHCGEQAEYRAPNEVLGQPAGERRAEADAGDLADEVSREQ